MRPTSGERALYSCEDRCLESRYFPQWCVPDAGRRRRRAPGGALFLAWVDPRSSMKFSVLLIIIVVLAGGTAVGGTHRASTPEVPTILPAVTALGIGLDTLLLGGYAAGSFAEAVEDISSDLNAEERALVGQHLDRIFAGLLEEDGLGKTGRLRVAYERAIRPDGSMRSIRVLGAEVAVSGRVHTAFYFERDGKPGYFDSFGRSLGSDGWSGPLASPRVSSPFGLQRPHPILNRVLPHTGVDLAAPMGEAVKAAADGIVSSAGTQGGYGLLIELQHPNGYSTRYAHLSAIAAGLGRTQAVSQGQVIGYVGMTGQATGPHLHYEVRRRGQPVDPMRLDSSAGPLAEIGFDPRWARERRQVGTLLAKTPTVIRN